MGHMEGLNRKRKNPKPFIFTQIIDAARLEEIRFHYGTVVNISSSPKEWNKELTVETQYCRESS